jgi:carbon monoxide dehydrogenase subunit G
MGLRFEHAFVVKAPAARVWAYLVDPYRVAPALPGASITEKTGDGSYGGLITVKVGPVSAKYKGTLRYEKLDEAGRTAEMVAKGLDTSGRGGADMKMQSRLVEKAPGETEVTVVSDVNVTGILAQMGRGLIQDVSNQMFQRFTAAVKAELEKAEEGEAGAPATSTTTTTTTTTSTTTTASTGAAPPIEVMSFGARILIRKPGFWIGVVAVAGIVTWLASR